MMSPECLITKGIAPTYKKRVIRNFLIVEEKPEKDVFELALKSFWRENVKMSVVLFSIFC
jgi:hypothetical protein